MVIEAGRPADDSGGGAADTAMGESALASGFDSAAVPARVDAGGGHLARTRDGQGVNWLLPLALAAMAAVAVPRVRAPRRR